jgi:hypothetical protein
MEREQEHYWRETEQAGKREGRKAGMRAREKERRGEEDVTEEKM